MANKPSIWLIFQDNQLLVQQSTQPLEDDAVASFQTQLQSSYLIGMHHEQEIYVASLAPTFTLPATLQLISLRKALECSGRDWYSLISKAYSIVNWDKNHHYCGLCASLTEKKEGFFERQCKQCHHIYYPRISPSVIVLIYDDQNRILMARGPHFAKGAYGLIAGFVEPGESAEDAVHREVAEEVAIKITELSYFGSQAWPFPDSLMFGFTARYLAGEIKINHTELEDAGWYALDALPGRPSSKLSISSKLLDYFIEQRKKFRYAILQTLSQGRVNPC